MTVSALSSTTSRKRTLFEEADQSRVPSTPSFPSVGHGTGTIYVDKGSFGHWMGYLTTEELSRSCLVSKNWRAFIDTPNGQFLWKNASIGEGVPVVEGENRDYKDEFRFLRPITIGGRTIARYLGEIVGEVPRMRQDCFLELRYSADFFEPAKFKRDTHVVLVDPAALKITTSPSRSLASLGRSGTLVKVPEEKRAQAPEEITVPFSFKNLKILAEYRLAGREYGPVFAINSMAQVLDQCNAPSDQNRILIMRKEVVAQNTPFNGDHGQKAQITNRRWEIGKVRQRGLFDAIKILETGICPDNTFVNARSAERVRLGGSHYNACIGGFDPRVGLHVFISSTLASNHAGVVPVCPAEVLRPLEPVETV